MCSMEAIQYLTMNRIFFQLKPWNFQIFFQEDFKILFKNNNFWLFVDFAESDQLELTVI